MQVGSTSDSAEPIVVNRDVKLISQGSDLGIDLYHGDFRSKKLAVAPLRYRPAAKPDHCDTLGPTIKEHESHHCAVIRKHQKIRVAG
jgi:hypothetical protein